MKESQSICPNCGSDNSFIVEYDTFAHTGCMDCEYDTAYDLNRSRYDNENNTYIYNNHRYDFRTYRLKNKTIIERYEDPAFIPTLQLELPLIDITNKSELEWAIKKYNMATIFK